MKIIDCEQRSAAWFEARLGKPTASSFCEIVTATGKARTGKGQRAYMLSLLGERLTRQPARGFTTPAMERGTELEASARAWYEFTTGASVREVGFILHESGRWGCSPDGIGDGFGLEIKCPGLPVFMDFAAGGDIPEDHYIQVQACLWITGLPRWDYMQWTDVAGLFPKVQEVGQDSKLFAAFDEVLPKWCDELDAMEKRMRDDGHGLPDGTPINMAGIEYELSAAEIAAIPELPANHI